jgi:hypothetical protein
MIVKPLTYGDCESNPFFQDRADWTISDGVIVNVDVCVGQTSFGVDADFLVMSAADKLENALSVEIARGSHAPAAQNASVPVKEYVRMGGVQIAFRKHVWEFGGHDAEAIPHRLKLAVAALFAEHAKVVAFDKEHLDKVLAIGCELLCFIDNNYSLAYRLRA